MDSRDLIVCRRDDRVRLFTRRGYDWTDRYPLIANAAAVLACDASACMPSARYHGPPMTLANMRAQAVSSASYATMSQC